MSRGGWDRSRATPQSLKGICRVRVCTHAGISDPGGAQPQSMLCGPGFESSRVGETSAEDRDSVLLQGCQVSRHFNSRSKVEFWAVWARALLTASKSSDVSSVRSRSSTIVHPRLHARFRSSRHIWTDWGPRPVQVAVLSTYRRAGRPNSIGRSSRVRIWLPLRCPNASEFRPKSCGCRVDSRLVPDLGASSMNRQLSALGSRPHPNGCGCVVRCFALSLLKAEEPS